MPPRILDDTYLRMVTQLGYDEELTAQLLDAHRIDHGLEALGEAWGRKFDAPSTPGCSTGTTSPGRVRPLRSIIRTAG